MENIKIDITTNGTTTLATAGKYCDRNIDVEVFVANGSGGGVSLTTSDGLIFLTADGEEFCVDGNDRLVDVTELPEKGVETLVYKTPSEYTDTVYLVKSEPREKTINVIPYQVTEMEVTAVDIGGAKMSGVVVIAGHTSVTSPVAATETNVTVYADMDGEWVYMNDAWMPFTDLITSTGLDASTYKGMAYDAPTTSSTPGLYLHFDEQYAPRKVTVTNVSDQYAAEGGSITVIYRDEIDNIDSPMVTSDELNPILYIINDVAYTHNGSKFVEWCAPTLDSFLKGKRVAEPPTTDSADGVYFVRSVTPVSFGIPTINADIFQNIEGAWKQLGHRRVVDASKFPKPGETGVSGGGSSKKVYDLYVVHHNLDGGIMDIEEMYKSMEATAVIIRVDDHNAVESPQTVDTETMTIPIYVDDTNVWAYQDGAWTIFWDSGFSGLTYHGIVTDKPTASSAEGCYVYEQSIPVGDQKVEVMYGSSSEEPIPISAIILLLMRAPCTTTLVDDHTAVESPVESTEAYVVIYADNTGAWAYAGGTWEDVFEEFLGASIPYLGVFTSHPEMTSTDMVSYTYVTDQVNGSIWMVNDSMCADVTTLLEAQLGLHPTSYTVVSDHNEVTSPEVFDMTTMSGPVYVDDTDIWAYVPDYGGWMGLVRDIMGNTPETMPFFNVTEPPTSSSPTGAYFVPVELSTGDGTVDPNFVPYDEDLIYKVTTKEGETNLYRVYDIGNGTIKVQDERKYNAQFSCTSDFIFVDDHTAIEDPIISKELNSTTYYVDGNEIWYFNNPGGWIRKCSSYSIVSEPPTVESAIGYYLVKATESVGIGVADPDVSVSQFDGNEWLNLGDTITTLEGQVEELGEQVTTLETEVNSLETENSSLETQVSNLTTRNTNLKTQVDTLTTEKTNLQSDLDATVPSMNFMNYAVLSGSEYGITLTSVTNTALESIKIHSSVTHVGDNAFDSCCNLTSVYIPNSVTRIENFAFYKCTSLTSVDIPNSVTSIGQYAFEQCSQLASINIPDSVVQLGHDAFGFSGLTSITIPGSINTINFRAFADCSNLTTATILDGVTYIGQATFYNCTSLTSITIPNSVTTIGQHAFEQCSQLASITIPDSVTSIDEYVCYGCSGLTSITIPNSVTTIGHHAFEQCSQLASINIPDSVTSIGKYVCYGCSSLTSITIPNSVTTIPISAFDECTSLASITIPNSVTSIRTSAFRKTRLASVTIPDSVTSIDGYVFDRCADLTSVTFGENSQLTSIGSGVFQYCTGLTDIAIPNNVTSIGQHTFRKCTSLTSIDIPDSVTSIAMYAFRECTNLTSVTFGENSQLTSIGSWAFYGCTALTSIIIPASVTSLSGYPFLKCEALESIIVEEGNTVYHSAGNCIIHTSNKSLDVGCKNSVIPTDGSVTTINQSAFRECTNLTTIIIPEGITSIGVQAFYVCTNLTSVDIPNSVTSIGGHAFSSCSNLTSVTFGENSQLTSIEQSTFDGCSNLTSITIPDSVTSIGQYAFYSCKKLTSITIPDNVISIYNYAFYLCTGLTSVTFGENSQLTSIDERAFQQCTSLTSITIPNGVTSIAQYAFYMCGNLTSITIPNVVTSIGKEAFGSCNGLTSITFTGTIEQWNAIEKIDLWNHNTGNYTIHCTDGDIAKT